MKTSFTFIDEFGNETTVARSGRLDDCVGVRNLEVLVDEFKIFLKAAGFSEPIINKIQIVEE